MSYCKELAQEIREYGKKRGAPVVLFDVPLVIESSIIKITKDTIGDNDDDNDSDDEVAGLWKQD